jgi:hypothetical protein
MKKIIPLLLIISISIFSGFEANAQFQVESNTKFKLADTNVSIFIDNKGRYNQADGYEFDTTIGNSDGLALEYGVTNTGGIFINGNTVIIWNTGQNNRLLRLFDADDMDSGTAEKWYIDGEGWQFINSDSVRKERIKTLDSSLNTILLLNPVSYHHKQSKSAQGNTSIQNTATSNNDNLYYGFLAQELKNVVPNLVGSDEGGNLSVNYIGLIPILTQALKDQQNMITNQKNQINTLTQQIQTIQNQIQTINTKIGN